MGRRRGRGRRSGGAHRRPASGPSTSRTRARSCRSTGSGRRPTRRPCTTSANGSPTTGSTPTGRIAPARDLLFGLPPRVGQWLDEPLRPAGRIATWRRRAGSPSRSTTRPSRSRVRRARARRYTGARMICSLLAAGKRVGITGTSHKVIGNLLRAVLERRGREGVASARSRRATKEQVLDDPRVTRGKDAADVRGAARRRARQPRRRDLVAVGVGQMIDRGRRPVRRRGRPDLAGQRPRHRPGDGQPRPARRPAAARPAAPRHASAGRGSVGAGARAWRRRHDAADRGLFLERPGGFIRTSASSPPKSSTTTGWSRRHTSKSQRVVAPGTRSTASGLAGRTSQRSARTTSRRRKPTRSPSSPGRSSRVVRHGSTAGQGILLNWDNRPLDDIGIPGRISRFQIGMASVQSGLDDTQRNTDRKDFVTYLGINPFSQVKNKWLSGLLFEMGAWLCNNDDRAGVSSGCNQLRIRDLGNGGRQTLFDTGTASIGRGLATFLMPGVTWEVGPYTLRVAGGFQRYEDSGTTTGRKQGNMFLIGHDLFLWSPKGFLTGSANTPGSILVGTHFERTDVSCTDALRCSGINGGEFHRDRFLLREMGCFLLCRATHEYWRECLVVRCFQP